MPDISTSFELKQKLRIPDWVIELVHCPSCKSKVTFNAKIQCIDKDCEMVFPVVDNVPILLAPEKSIFKIEDLVGKKDTYYKYTENRFIRLIERLTPSISANVKAKENFTKLSELLTNKFEGTAKVLVLGGVVSLDKVLISLFQIHQSIY